jgi:taurine---2-oxoglutarate transaminase
LTSAYLPLGALAVNERVFKHYENNVFWGGLTYSAHPMCLAAAKAVLQVMHEDDLVGNSKRMGKVLAAHLQRMKNAHPCVGDVRSIGLFGCLELVKNRKTKEPIAPYVGPAPPEINQMNAFIKEKGLYQFWWKNFLHTNPPLCVNEEELAEAFKVIDEALKIADKIVVE